tara:strand:- start:121 stop:537 length:417 start_codon:yes stop_codon:yes gene_type:complete
MSYAPVAFIAPNYRDFKTYWLKAYEPATTTPKTIGIIVNVLVEVAKLQLNADGFFVSAGGAIVMPYINGRYDAYLFRTEAEADANDTSSAIRVADNISPTGGEIESIDYGRVSEVAATLIDYGLITEAVTETIDYGSI